MTMTCDFMKLLNKTTSVFGKSRVFPEIKNSTNPHLWPAAAGSEPTCCRFQGKKRVPRQVLGVREISVPGTTAAGCASMRLWCRPPAGFLPETDSRFVANPAENSSSLIIESDIMYAGSCRCLWQKIDGLINSSSLFYVLWKGADVAKKFIAVNSPKNHKGYYKSPPRKVGFILLNPIYIFTLRLSEMHLKVTCHLLLDFPRKISKFFYWLFLITSWILHSTCKLTYLSYINHYQYLWTFFRKSGKKIAKSLSYAN